MSNCDVTVQVADDLGKVEIVDGAFRVVASGFGSLRHALAPGLYKARASAGGAHNETLFAVERASSALVIPLDAPRFATPVPLANTAASPPYQQQAVTDATAGPGADQGLGQGGGLLLCVRDPSDAHLRQQQATSDRQDNYRRSFDGFRLFSADDNLLLDIDSAAWRDPAHGMLLLHLELRPDYYILSYKPQGMEAVDIPLPVFKGWRSQLFLCIDLPRELETPGRADLAERALLLTPQAVPFNPGDRELRLTELARHALIDSRDAGVPAQLRNQLRKRNVNPMLGLLGAHLLLAEAQPDRMLLRDLADTLENRLGPDFPDLVALRIGLARLDDKTPALPAAISRPPLLRASWNLFVDHPALLAPGSLAHQTASQLVPCGPWFAWHPNVPVIRLMPPGELAKAHPASHLYYRLSTYIDLTGQRRRAAPKAPAPRDPDDARASRAMILQLAEQLAGRIGFNRLKAHAAGREWLAALSSVQKAFLPVLQLIHMQTEQGGDFTLDELMQLQRQLGVPLPVFRECVEDMLQKSGRLEATLTATGRLKDG